MSYRPKVFKLEYGLHIIIFVCKYFCKYEYFIHSILHLPQVLLCLAFPSKIPDPLSLLSLQMYK